MEEFNPYQAPSEEKDALPLFPEDRWEEIDVRVVSVRGRWSRRIVLAGTLNAEINYLAIGHGESVYVNGVLAARTSAWRWSLVAPHVDFYVEYDGCRVPASIDVSVSVPRLLAVAGFALIIAGKLVYQE